MKNVFKKTKINIYLLLFMLIVPILLFPLSGCSFKMDSVKQYEEGDFLYCYHGEKDKSAWLLGLSNEGKKKESVVIPKTLGGYEVTQLGYKFFYTEEGGLESDNLKKVYLSFQVTVLDCFFKNQDSLQKIIALYIPHHYYTKAKVLYPNNRDSQYKNLENSANVGFMFNYSTLDNYGYYWIDDCDYVSTIDYQPENPTRDGYIFGGWYKEENCTNQWDFTRDTLPEIKYKTDDNGDLTAEVEYQETKLYAKWVK